MRKSAYTSIFTLLAFWIVASFAQAAQNITEIKDGAKVYIRYNAGTDDNPVYYYINAGGYYSGTPILLYKMKYSEEGFLTNNIKHHFIKDVNLEYKDMDSFKNCVCDYLFSNLDKLKEENKLNEEE